jgi:DNA-directed RNA polymerase specialized sigma24 family protein
MNTELALRIEKLEPKLRALASKLSRDGHHADDLFQQAAIRILTTCTPSDSDSKIYLHAKSAMLHAVRDETVYTKYVGRRRRADRQARRRRR